MRDELKGNSVKLNGYSSKVVAICTVISLCLGMAGGVWLEYA